HKEKYFALLDKTGENVHTKLKTLISEKVEVLKISADLPTPQQDKISADLPVYIGEICTKDPERICPVTLQPIHMQKEESFLLSNTGLKHLEETNPQQFEFLKETLLTGSENKFERNIYDKISKQ